MRMFAPLKFETKIFLKVAHR